MNRADAIGLDEEKQSHIIPVGERIDPMIVEKSKFLYMVCGEGQLTKEEAALAKEKLLELIKSF